jgi:cupin 2 domain-containing protein
MNLFSYDIPQKDSEFFNTLLKEKNVTIKQIVSNTLSTPQTFCSKADEFVVVLKGCAKIEIDNEVKKLKTADTLFIPANTPHTLLKTRQIVVWLAIYIE